MITHIDTYLYCVVNMEVHAVVSSVVFGTAVLADAFAAHEPTVRNEAPSSMRMSAIVTLACLAAPPIRQKIATYQRFTIAAILMTLALVGWHHQSAGARLGDVVFTTVALTSTIAIFSRGGSGIENMGTQKKTHVSKDASVTYKREMVNVLAVALLLYSSTRQLRMAFRHPDAARNSTVQTTMYDGGVLLTPGYAYSSAPGAAAVAAGSAAGIGTALTLLWSSEFRSDGTSAATLVLITSCIAQVTCGFVAVLIMSEHLDNLPAVWNAQACAVRSVCEAAFETRRLSLLSHCPAGLFINGFGVLVLAFAPSLRVRTRTQMLEQPRTFALTIYGLVAVAVALITAFSYLSFSGGEALTDVAVVMSIVAVFLGTTFTGSYGSVLFAIAIAIDLIIMWIKSGAWNLLSNFSWSCNATMVVLLVLHATLVTIGELLWKRLPANALAAIDKIVGILAVSGTSIATALFFATCALHSTYDGQAFAASQFRAGPNKHARTAAAIAAEHWFPLLVWLPLYVCRCEQEDIPYSWRLTAWYTAIAVPVLIWLIALIASTASATAVWYVSGSFVVGVVLIGVLPWSLIVHS